MHVNRKYHGYINCCENIANHSRKTHPKSSAEEQQNVEKICRLYIYFSLFLACCFCNYILFRITMKKSFQFSFLLSPSLSCADSIGSSLPQCVAESCCPDLSRSSCLPHPSIFNILCFLFYILHFTFYIFYFIFYISYSIFSFFHFVFYIVYFILYILHFIFYIIYFTFYIIYFTFYILYYIFYILYFILYILHFIFYIIYFLFPSVLLSIFHRLFISLLRPLTF